MYLHLGIKLRVNKERKGYPSDVSDEEWSFLCQLFDPDEGGGAATGVFLAAERGQESSWHSRKCALKVDSTRKARIFAEQALQAEQIKLEHGTSTSFVVLQLQSSLTTARSSEIRALADYNIALEQLAFDEGTTLERNNIKLEVR